MMTHAEHTATGAPLMTDAVNGLRERAAARPQATLLVTRGRTYGYASFLKRALAVAEGLAAAGVGRGARVALFLEDYDQFFVAMMGAWLAGDVVVPLNVSLPRRDVDRLIAKAQPHALLLSSDEACLPDGEGRQAGTPLRLVMTADADGRVAGLRPAGAGTAPSAPCPAPAGDLEPVRPDELAMIMFTSGTTGVPKGVCQTLRAVSENAGLVAQVLGLAADDRIFINTPPYFTSGICHFLTLMAAGGGVAGQLGFYFGEGLLDEMEAQGCTGFGGAPAHLVRVVEPLEAPREHPFRFWVSSGDHLPLHVIDKARRVLPGIALFNMYGLTEVSGRLCVLLPEELDEREGSVGRPIGAMTVTARDARGAAVPAGETGELYVTGPLVMQGYLDEPEITVRTLTEHGLRTGDFGHVDADGYVWVAGRQDDIIKRGGEKVSVVHVQESLLALGRFHDVAVIAVPDEILGHVPVAFVVPREPDGFRGSRVLRELRDVLPSTSLPSRIVAVERIPRTGSGKAVRAELQRLLEESAG
ncbi:MAG TPA: class I adenylate-forming enzyme family protein [Thermoleophilia bacterium]|nr:class I adenylate-forming enzyme family protein [Thermoleophilia bacterium]